ncbi:zinc ribbon domain-containing protein [Candidatus Desulforudis audaxviator]|uniref:zinc ribbon domain-containing protein n=1 Tax=Candidatus Desulforudis audaxviator TaxID=471827 RepID=UPI00030989EA|nr:zinc ribbon domain-containing protein [Candidatus Desulforudis audaxviator]AZK59969.1 Transposase [Candidatus Desulforudis audaxviator]
MPVLKNVISSKQRIKRFITGTPEMIRQTEEIYRAVLGFYLNVIHDNLDKLPEWDRNSGTRALEKLTVRTEPRTNRKTGEKFGGNPNPPYPIDTVWPKFPAYLRRAIIAKAIGMAQSWYSNYRRWLRKKERMQARNERRVAEGKKPIPFDEHPPKYPTAGNVGMTFYKGDFKNLSLKTNTIQLKVWDGYDWRFITVEVESTSHSRKLHLDDSWEMTVPSIYEKEGIFCLVTAFEKKSNVIKFADYYLSKNPKVLAVDLNLGRRNRAVCALVGKGGTVHKVRHVSLAACNTTDVHRLLGLIARDVSGLGIVPKGHRPCKRLWRKVRAVNDNYAHHLSKQLVDLAVEWGARVIVFENLKRFRPDRDKHGSARMRRRIGYWLHRRVIKYTAYKAKVRGILIALVSPENTSNRCSLCGSLETVRNGNVLKCRNCSIVHNSHINAAINTGTAWFIREEKRLQQKTA